MPNFLHDLFAARFPADRTRPFLETPDGAVLTFADLDALTARYAGLLRRRGAGVGDRVAVQVDKSPEALVLYLACVRAGAVYLPLNPAYTPAEVDYFLGDAEPAVVVCRPQAEAAVRPLAERHGAKALLTLGADGDGTLPAEAAGEPAEFRNADRGPDDLAAILYTSGTTGRSKGAMLSHRNLGSNAEVLHRHWGFRPDDVLLHALPIFHTHGLFVATNCVLLNGGRMVFLRSFDADAVVRLLPRATVFMGVPTMYTRLLAHPGFTRETAAGMRLFVSGSAPLLADTFREFEERTGKRILERYGMTETNMNTSNPLDGERRAGTVGFPLPGVELRIRDEQGNDVEPGGVGVIQVRGPNVFGGYWRNPQKTAEEFREGGWFVTGDVGRVDADGYVHIVGRAKDLIISGGFNVYPKEVETVLDAQPGVAESAVFGVPHPDFGEGVTAAVLASPGASPDPQALIAACRAELAAFKTPKAVVVLDELPRNAMGKVQKNVLRDRYAALYAGG